jgi:hypothetical protein
MYVAEMEEIGNAYKILVKKLEVKGPFGKHLKNGR